MSIRDTQSLQEATAIIRGECSNPYPLEVFQPGELLLHRLKGINAAPGHDAFDLDVVWESVVRAAWAAGATFGISIEGYARECAWNILSSREWSNIRNTIESRMTGAILEQGNYAQTMQRYVQLPWRAVMAGHPGTGLEARLEQAVSAMKGERFIIIVLAKGMPPREIEALIAQLSDEEQYLRDQFIAPPGLRQNSHSGAEQYLELVKASSERAEAALNEGGWSCRVLLAAESRDGFVTAQSAIHAAYASEGGVPEPLRWQSVDDPRALTFLRSKELAALTRPPQRELDGFIFEASLVQTDSQTGGPRSALFHTTAQSTDGPGSIALGQILDDGNRASGWLHISLNDLTRHMLVAGMTGSGKSVTCEHILIQLWQEHRIPWLVIEPGMKNGYRRLKQSEIGKDINIWKIGDSEAAAFLPLNPLAAPPGTSVANHAEALYNVIVAASSEIPPPMPEVLRMAIKETYTSHGWNYRGRIPNTQAPMLSQLLEQVDRCTRLLGYDAELTGNIRAGLILRLGLLNQGPLGREFGTASTVEMQYLLRKPAVIELSEISGTDSEALVMGLLALQLRHHWRLSGQSSSIRHVTVIEEAHHLLKRVTDSGASTIQARTTEKLADMLAEMRGFGAGLIIVDQSPSDLVPATIQNTGSKILHRLDHVDDQMIAGRAAGLLNDQTSLLGQLTPGRAVVRLDGRTKPFRLQVPNPSITYH